MNYYKQGDVANADKIKAAFEKLGIDVLDFGFADKTLVYCSIGGCVQCLPYSINLMHILYSHPDYKELELNLEPKFKVGDWVVCWDRTYQILGNESTYIVRGINGLETRYEHSTVNENGRLWDIQDANDGDVLATDNGWTCIFKAFDGCVFSSYCFMDSENWFCEVGSEAHTLDSRINGNILPATKEQRDLLFKKMKEEGYQWDENKKELRKIQPHYYISNFKPFDKVLVRDRNDEPWRIAFYGYYKEEAHYSHFVGTCWSKQCIPFNEETKHLLGTTNPCDDRFINW